MPDAIARLRETLREPHDNYSDADGVVGPVWVVDDGERALILALLRVAEAAREADELIRGFLEDGIALNTTALDEAHEAMRDALRGLDDGEAE